MTNENEKSKDDYQAELLKNRLIKRYKHLKKWAKRNNVFCYRLYDKDIPEIPLAIDLYIDENEIDQYIQLALYERPYEKDKKEEQIWLSKMRNTICQVLEIPVSNVYIKIRRQLKDNTQYEKTNNAENDRKIIIKEQNAKFFVKMSSYLDTGLFFDHRPLRKIIRETCTGKCVLNLFCYTGSFSVYAAQGKAKSIDSVDLSNTYLEWAKDNFLLNGFNIDEKSNNINFKFHQNDIFIFLDNAQKKEKKWDIIILDPPTFSNSKKTNSILDLNKQWFILVNSCLQLLNPNGILYFSTNSRKLNFDESLIDDNHLIIDITDKTIPEDYRNTKIHRCWKILKE
ncbi:MAG: methyltransferase [Treponema sp.]|nr:methyltransferase [Treponema sp.]